jgi:hypothetical protein
MSDVVVKSIDTDERGNIVVIADIAGMTEHSIITAPEALPVRVELYDVVETNTEALDAILREHALRLDPALEPKSSGRVDTLGGLDDRVTVTWEAGAAADRDTLLANGG